MPMPTEVKLSKDGVKVLNSKNFVSHTRIYINDVLCVDTSTGVKNTPVISYQINRSRKLGAAKMYLNVANPDGVFSFKRDDDPIFGYGNRIKLQEGIPVGQTIEWFSRFTGIIVSQVASNLGGKPSLKVYAMDNMKLLLDYLPDELYYCPDIIPVNEILTEVPGGNLMHFRGNQENLPWVDIPYPIFYKDGVKIKEDYEVDLVNGEVYFGEKMWGRKKMEATPITSTKYSITKPIQPGYRVRRSFVMTSESYQQAYDDNELPKNVTVTCSGNEITFSKSPFGDLEQSSDIIYTDKKIYVTTEVPYVVTADYRYYDDRPNPSNLGRAENAIRDLALKAGFKEEQIKLDETGVLLSPMRFTNLTIKNAFDILQKIKQQLSPNYVITCDTEGNLRGYKAGQLLPTEYDEDYDLKLIKKIDAPVSEENLYSVIVAHGVDLNPNDLRSKATAQNLLMSNSVIKVGGSPASVLNKDANDQISWHWTKKNDDVPPTFPIDLMKITWAEKKKIEEFNILVGDYNNGTIQQSISVQVTEDGTNWFYIDQSSRGLSGASSQWIKVKGGELETRKIKGIKFIAEDAFGWTESHSYSDGGFLGFGSHVETDNYYHWYLAIKEVQIWEENTIAVTSSICNCIGIGDGVNHDFTIPNKPIVPGTVKLYKDGVELASALYSVDYATGDVTFFVAPQGVITADYTVQTKKHARNQLDYKDSNERVKLLDSLDAIVFTGGSDKSPAKLNLLKKIGLKKNALKIDNYLNSFFDTALRGDAVLGEISRLEETLDMDVVYRPDIDICQTIRVFDEVLGIGGYYFVEEITESKQGYRPSLNIKVSNYSQ